MMLLCLGTASTAIAVTSFRLAINHGASFLWFVPWLLGLPITVFSLVRMKTTGFGYHPLRYPMALWLASVVVVGLTGRKTLTVDRIASATIFVIPFLAIALYSFLEARKPDCGKQLNIPTSLEHAYRRLGWKWLTPPRWDFWLCWIGLLFSPLISTVLIVGQWDQAIDHAWLMGLRVVWMCLLVLFAYRWFLAPVKRDKCKETAVSAMSIRTIGFLYYYSLDFKSTEILNRLVSFVVACMLTSIFEQAYVRCMERQTPAGVGEYEALEGPSLGL